MLRGDVVVGFGGYLLPKKSSGESKSDNNRGIIPLDELKSRLEHHIENFAVSVPLKHLIIAFYEEKSYGAAAYSNGRAIATYYNGVYSVRMHMDADEQLRIYPSVTDPALFLLPKKYLKPDNRIKLIFRNNGQEVKASFKLEDCCTVLSIKDLANLIRNQNNPMYILRLQKSILSQMSHS